MSGVELVLACLAGVVMGASQVPSYDTVLHRNLMQEKASMAESGKAFTDTRQFKVMRTGSSAREIR